MLHNQIWHHVFRIHMGESNRKIPWGKKTNIDWPAIVKRINGLNFQGTLVFEPFVLNKSKNGKNVSLWREMKDEKNIYGLVEDARAGVNYLKSL